MIIINQNKNEIINFDNIERIDITASKDSLCYNVNFETAIARGVLGNYATEERAKEVLQEIVNLFGIRKIENKRYEESDLIMKFKKQAIYEMPKE